MDNIDKFVQLVQESDNIVFFGGAGVSTESGVPAVSYTHLRAHET